MLTDLAHELRTPLASILGYAELLAADNDDLQPRLHGMVHAIRRNAARQAGVLNNLATLADVRRGDLPQPTAAVDVARLVADLPDRLAGLLVHRQVHVTADCPAQLPDVRADAGRLRQALAELALGTADRCAPGGTVLIAASAQPGEVQVSFSANPAHGGHDGLHRVGLAMARAVVGEHGGRIRSRAADAATVVHLPSGRRRHRRKFSVELSSATRPSSR